MEILNLLQKCWEENFKYDSVVLVFYETEKDRIGV